MKSMTRFLVSPMGWFIFYLLIAGAFWFPTIRDDATPSGDGARIAPFIQQFDSHEAIIPMWTPINGGGPILASPERFYVLGYLLNVDESFNLALNLCLFSLIISVGAAGFWLARQLSILPSLASFYGLSIVITGYAIETERSARISAFTLLLCTLLCCFLLSRGKESANWLIPILVAVASYNGIHYAALTFASIIFFAIYLGRGAYRLSVISIARGLALSMPVVLPVVMHPIVNGWQGFDAHQYSISTVKLADALFPLEAKPSRDFLGYHLLFFVPMLLVGIVQRRARELLLLSPLLPWTYFVAADFSPALKTGIESSLVSSWRHNIVFFQALSIFGTLYLVKLVNSFSAPYRALTALLFAMTLAITFVDLYPFGLSEEREEDGRKLHTENSHHPAFELLQRAGIDEVRTRYRVFFDGSGERLPGYRTFRSFSLFNSNGYNQLLRSLEGSIIESRPHWSSFASPCKGENLNEFRSAGYKYFVCRKRRSELSYLEAEMRRVADHRGFVLYEAEHTKSFDVICPDSKDGLGGLEDNVCQGRVIGEISYAGDEIYGNLRVREKATIRLFENRALGWFAKLNNQLSVLGANDDYLLTLSLEPGEYDIKLRFIDVFFLLGLLLCVVYFSLERFFISVSGPRGSDTPVTE